MEQAFRVPCGECLLVHQRCQCQRKSSFVMQLGKELCKYGLVLYLSYEEGVNQTFQRRMEYLKMNEVQGKFRVVVDETYEELIDRLKKPKSPEVYHRGFVSGVGMGVSGCGSLDEAFSEKVLHLDQPGKRRACRWEAVRSVCVISVT